jgi:hypothetical protein
MSVLPPQRVNLTCPRCGAPISAEVHNLIDVGVNPELKGRLLRGRVNVAHCGNCGTEGVTATPILYHDAEKELLLAYVPTEMGLSNEEQQRTIGSLTNVLLAYLPPEKRKGYLLVPKVLLSYESLLQEVLRAEGITPEMMEAQRSRMALLDRLRQAGGQEQRLRSLIQEVDEQLDFEFFAILAAYIQGNREDGREDQARELEQLRELLLEESSYGREMAAQLLAEPSDRRLTREELLEELLSATSEQELTRLVAWYRSGVDYQFFQTLTQRMELAEQEGQEEQARRLRDLRETLLQITERMDAESRAALEQAAGLLRQLLEAEEPEAFIRQHLPEFDDAFFIVLGTNLQAAAEAGRGDLSDRLKELGGLVVEIAQEKLPPEVRLIRSLLVAPDDDAARTLLEENEPLVDEHLLAVMRDLADKVEEPGTAGRLQELVELIEQRHNDQA